MIHLITRLPLPYHQTLCRTLHDGLQGNFCAWFAERSNADFPFKAAPELSFRHHYLSEVGYTDLWHSLKQNPKAAVILGGWSSPMTKRTLLITSMLRVPVFIWSDHPHPRKRNRVTATLRESYLRLLSRAFVRGFLVCGEMTGEHLAEMGIPRDRIFNFPYWVDLPECWTLPNRCLESDHQRKPLRLLAVGRHVIGKGFDVAIRAVKVANERSGGRAAELVLVGDGPERANLQHLVASLGLEDSVSFSGWLENTAVQSELVRSDALIVPSEFEGYGVAVREALAQGRPVLCSDQVIAARDERVESNAILLHSFGDAETLAKHILLLARETDLLRNASEEARRLAEQWQPGRALAILRDILPEKTLWSSF
ncbi:MAG TPA: glycosyltransferase family 4 protein [Pyrinomonadaceae bacterium]|jgi:glycosyltransferase involved in cell wall biosynthesis|nr:glycosyltransferase family 4 protein [Pyrinomonadaceae bacterium]